MKRPRPAWLVALALACFTIGASCQNIALSEPHSARLGSARDFSDCATTVFRISNNRIFRSADVFKYVKLQVGQGTMDCMAVCRVNDDCWSFNFDKAKKWCYLLTNDGEDADKKRRFLWSSGWKKCVDHSDDMPWDNEPIDVATLKPTALKADVDIAGGVIAFDWKPAAGTSNLNGAAEPKYKIKCADANDDFTCDEAPVWSSLGLTTKTSLNADQALDALSDFDQAKCYVELYINGLKTSCSESFTITINPVSTVYWTGDTGAIATFSGISTYQYRVACYESDYSGVCNDDDADVVFLGAWAEGTDSAEDTASLNNLDVGEYKCFLRIRTLADKKFVGCTDGDVIEILP